MVIIILYAVTSNSDFMSLSSDFLRDFRFSLFVSAAYRVDVRSYYHGIILLRPITVRRAFLFLDFVRRSSSTPSEPPPTLTQAPFDII